MAAAASTTDDDDSFSSDSDDEFLTLGKDATNDASGGGADREALIRKKLLESFYGKSAVPDQAKLGASKGTDTDSRDSMDDDDEEENEDQDPLRAEDLDAPQFQAAVHTAKHVWSSGVHPLLETEESLACQVRTLDSSLQTLVYENYSRFIDATDAIRNIGVNVQANASHLQALQGNLATVSEASRSVEAAVGPLRDQVVEKLRVQRLLERLDTLLKLPTTLRQQIHSKKYRWATQSYLSAYSILSKHSAGFESLQRIETECHAIMTQLLVDCRRKLIHWSGELLLDDDDDDTSSLPDPPSSIAEILECAGTPALILKQQQQQQEELSSSESITVLVFDPHLAFEDCRNMALQASLRLLERILDIHHIEVQEQQASLLSPPLVSPIKTDPDATVSLIPTAVLDQILEASTLYSMIFLSNTNSTEGNTTEKNGHNERLAQFVTTAFHNFLQHVRGELLEQTMLHQELEIAASKPLSVTAVGNEDDTTAPNVQTEEEDRAYEIVTAAMSTLVLSVRQVASGLALPEVCISADLASSLVDQTVGLTEAMVRRRVDQKFGHLRLRVIQECLAPFCESVVQLGSAKADDESVSSSLLEAVQLASVALSDSLQLVDDTVRSILAVSTSLEDDDGCGGMGNASAKYFGIDDDTPTDGSMLQEAVEQSTKRFAKWLAGAMELLAGYDESSIDPNKLLVQVQAIPDTTGDEDTSTIQGSSSILYSSSKGAHTNTRSVSDDDLQSDVSANDNAGGSAVERALLELRSTTEPTLDMILAVGEMCRVAERSVLDNILQSIASHHPTAEGKRKVAAKSGGLFSEAEDNNETGNNPTKKISSLASKHPISQRFHLAASRVLSLYAMNRGHEAGQLLCSTLPELAQLEDDALLEGPHMVVPQVLELAKATCLDCADLFGGNRRAGPIPESLEDEYASLTSMSRQQHNTRSGLAFDVERMFLEKVVVYPDPTDMAEFQRNPLLALFFKVAFKAWGESARLVQFTTTGYRQLIVDAEFFKWFLSHYIKEEALQDGSSARTAVETLVAEVLQTGKERCVAGVLKDDVTETNQARAVIRHYMSSSSSNNPNAHSTFVIPED